MEIKKIRKGISRFFAWLGLRFASLVVRVLPFRFLYTLATGIAHLGYVLAGRHRRIASESLDIAFGDTKTSAEKKQIIRACFEEMARSGLELIFMIERRRFAEIKIEFRGKEILDDALAAGKGVILVSAHFGNFPLLLAALAREGYKVAGIMRHMRDSRTEEFFYQKRTQLNIRTIYSQPRNRCVSESISFLRNRGVLFIPLDQNFGTGGIFVDFFGRKAATATGPVILAQRTKAALIPCFIVRECYNIHRLIFEKPLQLDTNKPQQELVADAVQRLTNIIEAYIRRYPEHWGWIHRRWKTTPSAQA